MNNNNIDICCVTETWLDPNIPTEAVDVDGYILHRRDRSDGRQGGGVAAYVRSSLHCSKLNIEHENLETLWLLYRGCRMPRTVSHILIGIIYHPPGAENTAMTDHIVETADLILKQHPYAGIIILGDVNHLHDKILRDYPLKQTVKSATRGNALLDKIYSNISDWYLTPVILPNIAGSDHRTILLKPVDHNVKRGELIAVTVRSNDSNAKNLLARELTSINWLPLYRMQSVESMTSYLYSTVLNLLNKYLPERVTLRHTSNKPWVTDEFCRLIRRRQHAWSNNNIQEYKKLRNQVSRLSYKLRRQFYAKRIKDLRNCNALNWWRETKRLTGQSNKSDLTSLADNLCDGDVQTLANKINESLQLVSSDLDPLTENSTNYYPVPSEYIIFPEEVYAKLSQINVRKAPGPDELPNWFLKEFAYTLCDPICSIFNASVHEGIVPAIWKNANVVPIPKTKPVLSIENDLRPISLTPTLSKLLESFVGQWMLEIIEDKFDSKQFGGLRGRSTIYALIDILQIWHQALDDHKSVRVLFIDYAKAFDHVDHSIVLAKMSKMGIPDFIMKWMHSFLSNRNQRVKISQYMSHWMSLRGGMPQGTWLGLYIFLILINDLESTIPLHKYVDDVTASEVLATGQPSIMQSVMNDIATWSSNNLMNLNSKKTKEMLVGTILKNPPPNLILNNNLIERVHTFKLLGVCLTETLKWDENTASICSKANKRLHFLKLLKRSGMCTDDLIYYYSAVVRPVMEYGCILWQTSITEEQKHRLDSVQRRAIKIIGSADTDKITPLKDRRDEQARRLFQSILDPSNCIHSILPPHRNQQSIDRLRHAASYVIPFARTERYRRSFLIHSLTKYQI